jgi:hypothetical protein
MESWKSLVERQIAEATELGAFDNLPGKGQPIQFNESPFDPPLAATMRQILRDNGVSHPLREARRALEDELEASKRQFLKDGQEAAFRERIRLLNREVRLFNLRSPLPNFHMILFDAGAEIGRVRIPKESTQTK